MRHVNRILLAVGLLALPAAVSAQGPGGPGGRGMRGGAAGMALEHKAELNLTDEQVTKLQDIQKKLEEKNAPLREKMQKETNGTSLRELTDEQRAALRPTMEELRENSRKSADEVRGVLTKEQQEKLRELMPMRGRRGDRGGRPNG